MSDGDLVLERAIATISQSDPLLKLLEQVRLGRMKPGDPGLLAIFESWLATYGKSLELPGFTRQALLRLDPGPRLAMLMEEGMLPADHAGARALLTGYQQALLRAAT